MTVLGTAELVVDPTPELEAWRFAEGSGEAADALSGRGRFLVSARRISLARCVLSACFGVRGGTELVDGCPFNGLGG